MPKIEFRCNSKPSYFAYPPPLEEKKKEENEKVETAILSITNKKKALASASKKKGETGINFFEHSSDYSICH
jgi:26S proteasome regulatory subunit N2